MSSMTEMRTNNALTMDKFKRTIYYLFSSNYEVVRDCQYPKD